MTYLRFINHACFIIKGPTKKIIIDPWIEGKTFNNGWDLIKESNFNYNDFEDIDYIWFSHEHPDHFFPPNLKKIPENLRKKITVFFQKTHDKRVINFLKKLSFNIIEMDDHKKYELEKEFYITCNNEPFYDSYLHINVNGISILNLNDCVIHDTNKLKKIKKEFKKIDVLMTQFGIAGWVGNPDDKNSRKKYQNSLDQGIALRTRILEPKYVIPFASFINFCHEENKFMNDTKADLNKINNIILKNNSNPIFLYFNEVWDLKSEKDNGDTILNFQRDFQKPIEYIKSDKISYELISSNCVKSIKKIHLENNNLLLKILCFLKIIPKINFLVYDLKIFCSFDILNGLKIENQKPSKYIILGSDSLNFIFKNEFGFDSLLVNARFKLNYIKLKKVIRALGIYSLNASGRYINFSLIKNTNFNFFIEILNKIIFRSIR